jgi:hypothetical protein
LCINAFFLGFFAGPIHAKQIQKRNASMGGEEVMMYINVL